MEEVEQTQPQLQ